MAGEAASGPRPLVRSRRMSLSTVAAIGIAVLVGGALLYGVHRLSERVLSAMQREALEAARVLGFSTVVMTREEAEAAFAFEPGVILSDPVVLEGSMRGALVRIGAFAKESNTSVDGARVPIVVAYVQAAMVRPFGVELQIARRVFGMPESDVLFGTAIDAQCWIKTPSPQLVRARLDSPALQARIVEFVLEGAGNAFVYDTHVTMPVFHRSAERIRHAARSTAGLVLELDKIVSQAVSTTTTTGG